MTAAFGAASSRLVPHPDDVQVLNHYRDNASTNPVTRKSHIYHLKDLADFLRRRDKPPPGFSPLNSLADHLRATKVRAKDHPDIQAYIADRDTSKTDAVQIAGAADALALGIPARVLSAALHPDDAQVLNHYRDNASTSSATRNQHIYYLTGLAGFLRRRDQPPLGVSPLSTLTDHLRATKARAKDHPDIQAYMADQDTPKIEAKNIAGAADALALGIPARVLSAALHPDDVSVLNHYRDNASTSSATRKKHIQYLTGLASFLRRRDQPPPGVSPLNTITDHLRATKTRAKDHPDIQAYMADHDTPKANAEHIAGAADALVLGIPARVLGAR